MKEAMGTTEANEQGPTPANATSQPTNLLSISLFGVLFTLVLFQSGYQKQGNGSTDPIRVVKRTERSEDGARVCFGRRGRTLAFPRSGRNSLRTLLESRWLKRNGTEKDKNVGILGLEQSRVAVPGLQVRESAVFIFRPAFFSVSFHRLAQNTPMQPRSNPETRLNRK